MDDNRVSNFFEEEKDIGEEALVEYDITTSPRDLTPANIVDMIDSGIIEIPLFQRNYVWDIKKASKLVESLILGLPVPELFFYTEGDDNNTYKIIDGQQRFLSIYFFVKGRFPKSTSSRFMIREGINEGAALEELLPDNKIFKDFTLELNSDSTNPSKYHGKKFLTLDKDTQIKFRLRRFLRTVVVRQNKINAIKRKRKPIVDQMYNRMKAYNDNGVEHLSADDFYELFNGDKFRLMVEAIFDVKLRAQIQEAEEQIKNLTPLLDTNEQFAFEYAKQCDLKNAYVKCSFKDAEKAFLSLKLRRNQVAHNYVNGLSDTFNDIQKFYDIAVIYVVALEEAIENLTNT